MSYETPLPATPPHDLLPATPLMACYLLHPLTAQLAREMVSAMKDNMEREIVDVTIQAGDAWEMHGRCMRGRCMGDAWDMHGAAAWTHRVAAWTHRAHTGHTQGSRALSVSPDLALLPLCPTAPPLFLPCGPPGRVQLHQSTGARDYQGAAQGRHRKARTPGLVALRKATAGRP